MTAAKDPVLYIGYLLILCTLLVIGISILTGQSGISYWRALKVQKKLLQTEIVQQQLQINLYKKEVFIQDPTLYKSVLGTQFGYIPKGSIQID
jgi:hypothetical protein